MLRGGITCGLEEQGADGDVVSLRVALQRVEKGGMVDFSLGGHTCARPAAVAQGHQDDHFQVAPDAAQALLWSALVESPLVLVPWDNMFHK